jgi:glutamate 5-kinase
MARESLNKTRCLVVKIGTSSLLDERGLLDQATIARHLKDLVRLSRQGIRVVLVSSGAIGAGCVKLAIAERPATIPELQATAAVGQSVLMNAYNTLLAQEEHTAAQLLLTHEDFRDRRRYLNMRNTLAALHGKPVLPVINENDTVAVEEIRFGDNDVLAALVTGLMGADAAVFLSNVDGFILDGEQLDEVQEISEAMEAAAGPGTGRGGMKSKLQAARMITRAGAHAVIANGKRVSVPAILAGEQVGTLFTARGALDSRGRWVHGLAESGSLTVDAGGAQAVRDNGSSLLPVGVTGCTGRFETGDAVLVLGPDGPLAKGLTNYGSDEVLRIMGKKTEEIAETLGIKSFDEVIHRDNLVLL